MTEPLILSQLRTKQAQILDVVAYHETKLGEAKAHLTHVNAVICLRFLQNSGRFWVGGSGIPARLLVLA